ncbi:hypothetical protein CC80DRAFT_493846 [Byssothecium circinans]|uniref:Uncharacterized protein n=1 Tax=Byssothecium circinans TaxID=147558 RepID=A0A6A5TUI9_9PLEO|nr:hypothetical protein CC80DRAFT_493846 [Byssothecium circinans]
MSETATTDPTNPSSLVIDTSSETITRSDEPNEQPTSSASPSSNEHDAIPTPANSQKLSPEPSSSQVKPHLRTLISVLSLVLTLVIGAATWAGQNYSNKLAVTSTNVSVYGICMYGP